MPTTRWTQTAEERFWAKVQKTDRCWLWMAGKSKAGYGYLWVDGKQIRAHCYSYQLHNGPIPDGLVIDHVKARGCTNRHCVNPAHLEAVTQRINILRAESPVARHAEQTHCLRGHPFDEHNTCLRRGRRECRTCRRLATRKML